MTKSITIGDARIPLDSYAIGGTALLGIRGSGKTWTAKGIAEQLLEHRVPIIVFDPIGVWRHLKAPAAKNGKGYPVVVAGGRGADLPLTPASATEIVRAAMRENIPLVVDLYDKTMSKSDWRRIVQTCFRTLLYENEGVRHIFLEEAAEYVPQKVQDGETYAEVEKLVRMGGNASLGITLINQRAQEVNKAVLDLCENLVLMRQIGAHAIDALEKWIDKVSPDFASEIASAMPKMKAGDAWVFAGGAEKPIFTHTGGIRTYHPDRKNPDSKVVPAATDASAFVLAMQRALPAIVEQQKENDPKALKARIRELEAAAKKPGPKMPLVEQVDRGSEVRELRARVKFLERVNEQLQGYADALFAGAAISQAAAEELEQKAREIRSIRWPKQLKVETSPGKLTILNGSKAAPAAPTPRPATGPTLPRTASAAGSSELGKGERAILIAIAQSGEADEAELTVLTGYKRSSRNTYLQRLRSSGFVTAGWPVRVTDAGLEALGDFEPLPTGDELARYWIDELGDGGEAKILRVLLQRETSGVTPEELDEQTNYQRSSRNTYLQRLGARKLIEKRGGRIFASERLFG